MDTESPTGHIYYPHGADSPTLFDEALQPHANFLHKAEVMTLRFVLYIVFIVLVMFVLTHAMGCNKCGGKPTDGKGSASADTKKCSPNCTLLNTLSNAINKGVNWFMQYGLLFFLGLAVLTKLPTEGIMKAWAKSKGNAEVEVNGVGEDTAERRAALNEAAGDAWDEATREEYPEETDAERDAQNPFIEGE